MDDDTPQKELPPSDQPWGNDSDILQEFLANTAKIVFDYYNYLCEIGFGKPEALALTQVFEMQYWAMWLNTIYRGKSKTSD